jgi:hypothetical protein
MSARRKTSAYAFLLSCSVGLWSSASVRAALLGYWNFDEASGNVAHNSIAGGVDGTLMGGASFVATGGARFGAIRFDQATNDHVSFGNNFSFPTGSFSVVAWVKIVPGDVRGMFPLAKYSGGSANGYYLAINDVGDGFVGAAPPMVTNSAPFLIGGIVDSLVARNQFAGLIDEVRVYNHALSVGEVNQIYFTTIPAPNASSALTASIFFVAALRRG